ncbi:tektin-1 [Cimex lectularius]|uniref:Tektin n=1 Tax=Cimex lectularius TaxID=79782 RepID=A0A8I6SCN9_CIMLE|nr:tektin-1 [Cimex lectularius]
MPREEIDPSRALKALAPLPRRPPRFTLEEWHLTNISRFKDILAQQKLADRMLTEAERVIDLTTDSTVKNKLEVEHQLTVKIRDIEFKAEQIQSQKKNIDIEIEALKTYSIRLEDAQANLGHKALEICKKCIVLREGRLGVDLCIDEVDLALANEMHVIKNVQGMMMRLREQVKEQVRRLRAMNYSLSRDLEDKNNVVNIDKHNLTLNEKSMCLSIYHGSARLDPASITQDEWEGHTIDTIEKAGKELNAGRPLRAYIDVILQQIIEDLWKQYDIVNAAFARRISEYRELKIKLENLHFETVRQVNEMTMKLTSLKKALAEKEGFMALAHTRLGNRCQRVNFELCRDEAETYLVNEVHQLKDNVGKLQMMIEETQASLRYLLRAQVQLEEDINVKTNSLKIDEVDCMSLRAGMDYHAY